jgi:hypothetical protein
MKALVLDLMPKGESPHEGQITTWMLRNMGWKVKDVLKPSRQQMLENLFEGYRYKVIHLSAHSGAYYLNAGRQGVGIVTVGEITDYFQSRLDPGETRLDETLLVVNTGCNTASRDWSNLFTEILGAKYYLGSAGDPTILEGIMFPLLVYGEMWGQPKRPRVEMAFRGAKKSLPRTRGRWSLFTRGRSCATVWA